MKLKFYQMSNGIFPECPYCKKLMAENLGLQNIAWVCFWCGIKIIDKNYFKRPTNKTGLLKVK